jgi:putative MFS transporter
MVPGILGQGMGSAIWGFVGDRKGHHIIQVAICVQAALAGLVALLAPNAWVFAGAFWLMGMSDAADWISTNNFMIESAPPADKMGYVSFANTLIAPVFALATVMGGAIAGATSYYVLFALSILVYLAALWLMATRVHDPRAKAGAQPAAPGADQPPPLPPFPSRQARP